MRRATANDYPFFRLVAEECSMEPIPEERLEAALCFVGEHGYFVIDVQSETEGIVHVAILPQGRGKWAAGFFREFIRWSFTSTRVERLNAAIPKPAKNVKRFAIDAGFVVIGETRDYTYLRIDMLGWIFADDACLNAGPFAHSDYPFADQEMVRRVTGACAMMHEAGMEHKAWYLYVLCAKLFGYMVEV